MARGACTRFATPPHPPTPPGPSSILDGCGATDAASRATALGRRLAGDESRRARPPAAQADSAICAETPFHQCGARAMRAARRAAPIARQPAKGKTQPRRTPDRGKRWRTPRKAAPEKTMRRSLSACGASFFFRTARRGVASRDRRAQRIRTRGARSTTRPPRSMPMRESSAPMPTRCCLRRPTARPTACASRRRRRSHP